MPGPFQGSTFESGEVRQVATIDRVLLRDTNGNTLGKWDLEGIEVAEQLDLKAHVNMGARLLVVTVQLEDGES